MFVLGVIRVSAGISVNVMRVSVNIFVCKCKRTCKYVQVCTCVYVL